MGTQGQPQLESTARLLNFKKGEMMKNAKKVKSKKTICLFTFAFLLCGLVFWLGGCKSYEQLGETTAEGRRRHLRTLRINRQEMMGDIDRAMLLDKPSKLTDKRIP